MLGGQGRDAGEVIVWRDGPTITFRAELLEVLRRLAPQGLPPLGAVLLLLAATRDSWELVSAERSLLPPLPSTKERELTRDVLLGLELVSRLEPELRASVEARAAIAEMVFEDSRRQLSPQHSLNVIGLLEGGITEVLLEPYTFTTRVADDDATPVTHDFSTRERANELRALRRGLGGIDPVALKLRMSTGLDALPAAAPLELPVADQVRAPLKALDQDQEFRGLARLARDLTAAVTLPRAISDTEEMPLGGVSDITNRGPLDRLLLSELAHDDLVLAVRVAVNEAMYLRRETPPHAPVPGRAVLLDVGIRSWGVPRVFATSVALALAATSDRRAPCVVYRARGFAAEPVDLSRREGLVQHLAALEPDLHPGAALKTFDHASTGAPILLQYSRGLQPSLLVHVLGSDPIVPRQLFAGASASISQGCWAGGIHGLSAQVIAAACGPAGITWVIEERDQQFILIALQPTGELLSSHLLPLQGNSGRVPKLAIHDGCVWIAAGDCVYAFRNQELQLMLELAQPIESIVTPLPHTRNRLAVTFATGGLLIWPDFDDNATTPFATEMDAPLLAFNQTSMIAVNETFCEVYHTRAGCVDLKACLISPRPRPVAVLPATSANQFMVLTEDGMLSVYGVS